MVLSSNIKAENYPADLFRKALDVNLTGSFVSKHFLSGSVRNPSGKQLIKALQIRRSPRISCYISPHDQLLHHHQAPKQDTHHPLPPARLLHLRPRHASAPHPRLHHLPLLHRRRPRPPPAATMRLQRVQSRRDPALQEPSRRMGPAWDPLQYHRSGVYGYGAESGGIAGGAEKTLVGLGSLFLYLFIGNLGFWGR